MRQRPPNLNSAVQQFAQALYDYHAASNQMSQALGRLVRHNRAFCTELHKIVLRTSATRASRLL